MVWEVVEEVERLSKMLGSGAAAAAVSPGDTAQQQQLWSKKKDFWETKPIGPLF